MQDYDEHGHSSDGVQDEIGLVIITTPTDDSAGPDVAAQIRHVPAASV